MARQPHHIYDAEYDAAHALRERGFRMLNSRWAIVRAMGFHCIDVAEQRRCEVIVRSWAPPKKS